MSCFFGLGERASMRPQRRAYSDMVFVVDISVVPVPGWVNYRRCKAAWVLGAVVPN